MPFFPLEAQSSQGATRRQGFIPLDEPEAEAPQPENGAVKTLRAIGQVYPVAETAANLASQAVALPAAGLAGLGTLATNAMGLTDADPAEVVHQVGGALTYQPQTELGQHLTEAAMYPFIKLQEAGQAAGTKTLEATGSPAAATAVDTAIQASPMALGIRPKPKGVLTRAAESVQPEPVMVEPRQPVPVMPVTRQPVTTETALADAPIPIVEAARMTQEAPEPAGMMDGIPETGKLPVALPDAPDAVKPVELPEIRMQEAPPIEARPGEAVTQALPERLAVEAATLPAELNVSGLSAERPGFTPLELQARQAMDAEKTALDAAAHEAATSPLNDRPAPSPAQIEAGNYKKGSVSLYGLDIAIENPAGSVRSGIGHDGKPWQTQMQHHYGYIRGTVGRDKDHLDVFIGDKPESQRVFVIDQIDPKTGKHDEHKVILGTETPEQARETYLANYEPGWQGLGAITEMPMEAFKAWAKSDQTKKPLALHSNKKREGFTPIEGIEVMERPHEPAMDSTRPQAMQTLNAGTPETLNAWAPGANYVGLVDDAKGPASQARTAVEMPAPIRREHVVKDFAQAIGTTVYEGRVKGKRLGFFRPGNEEVRIKRVNDIEVAAHEVAHLIDSRIPAISQAWRTDKALREELRSVSYDRKNVKEGFAEAVRLYLTQPDALAAKAPKAHAWLEGFARTHEYGPALQKAQADMTAWYGQDALNRARSKIGAEKRLSDHLDGLFDRLRQATVDDLHGIYKMERDLTGKVNPVGPYESARLSRASASIADGAIRFGHPVKKPDGSFTFAGKGLEEILSPVSGKLEDALLYFVGRSARELQAQGREHLFTPAEVDAMLRLATPVRKKAFEDYQAWNRGVLDFAEAQGVINPQARALWQRTQYLPFHRVGQAGEFKGGKPGDWSGIKALTGGTENLRDILSNMVGNAATLIDKAVKNEARLKIADLAEQHKGGRFMVRIDPEARPVKVDPRQAADAILKAMGIDRAEWQARGQKLPKFAERIVKELENAPDFMEFMIGNQPPAGRNVVAVLRAGKPVWYEVGDPILYRALSSIDRQNQHWLVNWLGLPKRVGQASITLTPDFWLANIARDTLMGSIMSRAGFKPVLDSLQGMWLRMTNDPVYKEYLANGGGLSSIYLDEPKLRAKLEKFYTRQGINYRTVLDTPEKLLGFVETLGDAFEMSTRLGEFKRAVAAGEHPRHAAYLGREVSTDFAARGDSQALGLMYDTVMFLKPAVLSWDRLARGLAHDPNRGAIAIKAGTLALASVALYLLNRDDPRYADLPDWDRDVNWHFFIGDQHFRWPKIWEIGALASAAERTTERTLEGAPEGVVKDFTRIVGQTFHVNLMPQIVAPLYEQAVNRNTFTGAPIETPGMEDVQPFLRAKPTTNEVLKEIGFATRDLPEGWQINPVRTEALLRGYLNTWAMYGLMLADSALYGDRLPERRTDELPVVRRFYAQEPARHTKHEEAFYELLEEAQKLRGTMKALDDLGRQDLGDKYAEAPLANSEKQLERASRSLRAITKDMNAVRLDPALTREEKRRRLNALQAEKNALFKEVVQDVEAQVGR